MVWPFSRRKRKKKRKPAAQAKPESPHAKRRKQQLTEKRRRKGRHKGTHKGSPGLREYEELGEIHPQYRAPPGPVRWQWVKRAPPDYFVEGWHELNPWGFEDYRRWPRDPAPRMAKAIRRHVLELILEAGRSQWPQEFAGLMRAEEGVIEELVLLPGTVSGDSHAIFQFHMMPSDPGIVGTIHSHPNPIPYPSAADTELFRSHGRIHIIACYPFRADDWNAFNERSYKIELKVVD